MEDVLDREQVEWITHQLHRLAARASGGVEPEEVEQGVLELRAHDAAFRERVAELEGVADAARSVVRARRQARFVEEMDTRTIDDLKDAVDRLEADDG